MYKVLLFLHFFGISIGAGTGIYLLSLRQYATLNLEPAEARTLMPGVAGAISRIGNLGLVLLIISGLGMFYLVGSGIISTVFLVKMALIFLLVLFVLLMNRLARRVATKGDLTAAKTMQRLVPFGPLLGVLIILAAVMTFH
jgi:uncharacterized membrane protein